MKLRKESKQDDSRSRDKDGASQGDEGVVDSPAISDMDMEDDFSPDGYYGFDHVTEVSTRETISGSNKMDVVKEPLHVMEKIDSVVAVSDTIPCSDALLFVPDGEALREPEMANIRASEPEIFSQEMGNGISTTRNCSRPLKFKDGEMEDPYTVIEENRNMSTAPPGRRVESMFQEIKKKFPGPPYFLLCILPERKNSDVYGPWKRKFLSEWGIFTQCIAPTKVNDQYLTNVLLKINAKLRGINSVLQVEDLATIRLVSRVPTIIVGMDVSHGSPGQSDVPSIAAVVSSREWPLITKYRASVRTQSPKVEMMDSLFKLVQKEENGATVTKDEGIIQDLMIDIYTSSRKRKPEHIIIFRRRLVEDARELSNRMAKRDVVTWIEMICYYE